VDARSEERNGGKQELFGAPSNSSAQSPELSPDEQKLERKGRRNWINMEESLQWADNT